MNKFDEQRIASFDDLGLFELHDQELRDVSLVAAAGLPGGMRAPDGDTGCIDGNCGGIDTGCHLNVGVCVIVDVLCF